MQNRSSNTYIQLLGFCRILAGLLGASLMIGETVRSWGQQRHFLYVVDDFLIGIPLVVIAILMGRPTVVRHCALTAAFSGTVAMLYGSFFTKIVDPLRPQSSNMDIGLLATLVGLAFLLSIVGLIASFICVAIWKDAVPNSATTKIEQ